MEEKNQSKYVVHVVGSSKHEPIPISKIKNLFLFYFIHTVTGASTRCTFDSSTRISRALRHKALTSPSLKYSHRLRRSICSSKHEFPPLVNDEAVIFVVRGKAGALEVPLSVSPERWLLGMAVAVVALIVVAIYFSALLCLLLIDFLSQPITFPMSTNW